MTVQTFLGPWLQWYSTALARQHYARSNRVGSTKTNRGRSGGRGYTIIGVGVNEGAWLKINRCRKHACRFVFIYCGLVQWQHVKSKKTILGKESVSNNHSEFTHNEETEVRFLYPQQEVNTRRWFGGSRKTISTWNCQGVRRKRFGNRRGPICGLCSLIFYLLIRRRKEFRGTEHVDC